MAAPDGSPEQRWRAAVKARPLEAPRPFPANLRPLVARFAGDAGRASYTTGPATREALAQAGALGATTGSVVHLPGAPAAAMSADLTGVLAHELSHARQPVGRPRFLLRVQSGAMDADERAAHVVGQQAAVGTAASVFADSSGFSGASGFSGSGGSHGGPAPAVRRSISAPTLPGHLGAVPPPGSVAPGLVDQLPVGAASGNAVSEARSAASGLASGLPGLSDMSSMSGSDATARGLLAALAAADPGGAAALAESAVGRGAEEFGGHGGHELDSDAAAATAASSPGAPGAPAHGAAPASAPRHLPDTDIERIVEAVEQRLLRQLERRGGRYAGVF
ncbi:DUF4157 domain-containing protein [Catenulispora sp. GAS73]|uniref:eCIS core domain-containing protein n=1 Tax=Catenulispora sp. GAS73 TaxID=3156269 RepID=UPI0035156148